MAYFTCRIKLRSMFSVKALGCLAAMTMCFIIYAHLSSFVMENKRGIWSSVISNSSESDEKESHSYEMQACIHPTLDIRDAAMMKFYKKVPAFECKGEKNWAYVINGTLRYTIELKNSKEDFQCDYYPLIRGVGDYNISYGDPVEDIKDGDPLVSDFFKLSCTGANNKTYENIHAGIHVNVTIKERLKTVKPPANGLGLSIALLGFDSMSRMSWLRRMPKTREYLVKDLHAIELEGFNILGDGTPAALLPILTGLHEQELPEARRGFKGAKPVDDFPWLWKNFSAHGYVTSWADAQVAIAPFNYRLLGFEHAPADYFMRPYFLAVDPTYKTYSPDCQGSETNHAVWFNWIRDIFHMYKDDPKFMFHFYTPLSHDDNNKITAADDDLKKFLNDLEVGDFLNNTLLIVMADHGARFANVRRTLSGKLEERLPYVSLRFPPWFENKYPHIVKNVRTNAHRLTTAFDLHETFKDFLKFDGAGLGDSKNRGISLFKEIPKSRTCAHADVAPHWCACFAWEAVQETEPNANRALQTALDTLNNFTQPYRSDCALLGIGNITMVSKMFTSDDVLKFKQTKGDRGLVAEMTDESSKNEKVMYQLTFFTEPGHGEFEITLEHELSTNKMTVSPKAISRINKYGNDPACILDRNREIRQYCYCKKNL